MKQEYKPIEIFCGTGGVGKTTLATSRAHYLANQGKKVLLITIDPSQRLKEVLNLDEAQMGVVEKLGPKTISNSKANFEFDALLMSPQHTFNRIAKNKNESNRILNILSRPYGGMNEILAMVEVDFYLQQKAYDCIVLDTPPGGHFVDFLNSCNKIKTFFHPAFVEVFKFIANRMDGGPREKRKIVTTILYSGTRKLLGYFEKITGATFIQEFIKAVTTIYDIKDSFLSAFDLQLKLKERSFSNWFLVTSADHDKITEIQALGKSFAAFFHQDSFLVINKSLEEKLISWEISANNMEEIEQSTLVKLKKSLETREAEITKRAEKLSSKLLKFPEVLSSSCALHVVELANKWDQIV